MTSAASLLPHLSWAKVDADDGDVDRDLKLILCEQDFRSLCGHPRPEHGYKYVSDFDVLQSLEDKPYPTAVYYHGYDNDGRCVKVCVIRDTTTPH